MECLLSASGMRAYAVYNSVRTRPTVQIEGVANVRKQELMQVVLLLNLLSRLLGVRPMSEQHRTVAFGS
jgi:hypothetical protein